MRGLWLLLVAGATLLAWLQLAPLPPAARFWAAVLIVPLPALMVAQARGLEELQPFPRRQAYYSSIISLWALAFATVAINHVSGYAPAHIGLVGMDAVPFVVWTLVATAAGIAVLFLFRAVGVREPPLMKELLPAARGDRLVFAAVSVTAGICEEIIFRGFLLTMLHAATGSLTLALVVSSGAFGVLHAYQQPAGALRAALLGALLAVPLLLHGSLIPSIIAHVLIDLISGLWLARYLLR